jgi:hypothetical protein
MIFKKRLFIFTAFIFLSSFADSILADVISRSKQSEKSLSGLGTATKTGKTKAVKLEAVFRQGSQLSTYIIKSAPQGLEIKFFDNQGQRRSSTLTQKDLSFIVKKVMEVSSSKNIPTSCSRNYYKLIPVNINALTSPRMGCLRTNDRAVQQLREVLQLASLPIRAP